MIPPVDRARELITNALDLLDTRPLLAAGILNDAATALTTSGKFDTSTSMKPSGWVGLDLNGVNTRRKVSR